MERNYQEELEEVIEYINEQLNELDEKSKSDKYKSPGLYLAKMNFTKIKADILKYLNDIKIKEELKNSLEKKLKDLDLEKIDTFADLIYILKETK